MMSSTQHFIQLSIASLFLLLLTYPGVNSKKLRHEVIEELKKKHGPAFQLPKINHAFEGVVDREDWEKASNKAVGEQPVINATSLNAKIAGFEMTTFWGRTIYAFQGLPYAKQKPDRFKPPAALEGPDFGITDGYLNATHLPEKCSQHAVMVPSIAAGSEDCLYANVYTPYLASEDGSFPKALPVMIFFHGGAFIWGDSSLYLPTRLLDEDVILIVPHYRLGSFGFFTTLDDRAPGNVALYDQQMSMMWVRDHIRDFGGDPDRVTIFGQSAGSASVSLHLVSPASAGLFKNVIAESGSAIEHWSIDQDPLGSAFAIGEVNGCNTTSIDTIYDCMMELDESVITLGINTLSKIDRKEGGMGFRGTAPIIQNFLLNETTPLIVKHPILYYKDGDFNKNVNLMQGACKHEGSYIVGIMYSGYLVPKGLEDNATYIQEQMVDDVLKSFGIVDLTHAISESFWEDYLAYADRTDFANTTTGMIDMSGVLFLKAGAWETSKLHSNFKDPDVKTFFYSFDFESDDTMFLWLFMGHHPTEFPFEGGVTHSDELMYLFTWPALMEGAQVAVMNKMVKLWTNFATYSDPTPAETKDDWNGEHGIPKWEQMTLTGEHYMLMEEEFTIARQYPDRWTISVQDAFNRSDSGSDVTPTTDETTTMPGETTTYNSGKCYSESQYDELQDERDAYLAAMIVFLVFFVGTCVAAGFFFWKWRY